jgi:putative component of toxin-antitoxin plasmid stabilization module
MTEHQLSPVFEGHNNVCIIGRYDGDDNASDFLKAIDDKDAGKFRRYLERLRDGFHVSSPENMRHIKVPDPKGAGAEVHELKVHRNGGLRLYLVRFESRWYLTHGGKKVADSKVPKEAAKAFAIFWND